ncbi:MAG: 3D domain-containing protein [Candidatus Komeilibacteria bacterium]|nr:3D domain-containing protein [Candidatus Komeilibacteria bacterium]
MIVKIKRIYRKTVKFGQNTVFPLLLWLVMILQLAFPQYAVAAGSTNELDIASASNKGTWDYNIALPTVNDRPAVRTVYISVTAYNSVPGQTDTTPCHTASGLELCERAVEDIIATNYLNLNFGTHVRFPDLFGDKLFRVEDRMNARYSDRVDIWMKDVPTARKFGKKYTRMEILY